MKGNQKLNEIIDLIFETFHVSVAYYPIDQTHSSYQRKRMEETIFMDDLEPEDIHLADWQKIISDQVPKILCAPFNENYIGIGISIPEDETGLLLIGPSLYKPMQAELLKRNFGSLSSIKQEELLSYCNHLPVLSFDQLNHLARLAYFMIYQKYLPIELVIEQNFFDLNAICSARGKFQKSFSHARLNTQFHHSYEWEKSVFDCMRRGDTKSLLYHLNRSIDGTMGVLAENDPVRSEKNIIISVAAIAARLAIEEGLPAPLCYGMNDSYVQLTEAATTLDELHPLMVTMLCDFCNLIQEHKDLPYCNLVKRCIDYIYVNLYEKFTVAEISQELDCNANYLSRLFKQEVGKTITEITTYERIEEAKRLLQFTKLSIIDIAAIMQFNDQSHFTRVFRKLTGLTPKKYRDQY